jgi:integrase
MGEQHFVPLSRQAVDILRELHPLTNRGGYVSPSLLTRDLPMSENTTNAALRRLGYDGNEQTGYSFRSMASTLLNEQGFPPDVVEFQLAHTERNKVRAAYTRRSAWESGGTSCNGGRTTWTDCSQVRTPRQLHKFVTQFLPLRSHNNS